MRRQRHSPSRVAEPGRGRASRHARPRGTPPAHPAADGGAVAGRPPEAGPHVFSRSNEYASVIVHAMETGRPRVIYGNVRNTGLVPGLPEDCCVEVPCLVDATGLHPVAVPEYPPELAALNRTFVNVVELTVRAVLDERPELARLAAMLDPNAAASLTLDQIDAVCEELLP